MVISELGIKLVVHYESLHDGDLTQVGLQPKMCPAGIWTVGYGRALRDAEGCWLIGEEDKGEAYAKYPSLTEAEAEKMLAEDCLYYERKIELLNLPLKQQEFDALVSFAYNVGFSNLKSSTLLKYIQKGDTSEEEITWAFEMWNKARVKDHLTALPGLTFRRHSEAHLFLTGELVFYN